MVDPPVRRRTHVIRSVYRRRMGITELIVAEGNRQISGAEMLRGMLEHEPWWMATMQGAGIHGVMFFPTREAYDAAVRERKPGTFGEIRPVARIDEEIAAFGDDVQVVMFDSGAGLTRGLDGEGLAALRAMARGVGIERAIRDGRYADLRRYDRYFVAYFGVLGEGHQVICLPTEHGSMIAAFTAEDAVDRFVASGTEADRARVKFVGVDGETLFGKAAPAMAQGVIVNIAGPRTYGFVLDTCRDIASA